MFISIWNHTITNVVLESNFTDTERACTQTGKCFINEFPKWSLTIDLGIKGQYTKPEILERAPIGVPTTGFWFYQTVCTYVSTRGNTQPSNNLVQIFVSAKAWTSLLITNLKIPLFVVGRRGTKLFLQP